MRFAIPTPSPGRITLATAPDPDRLAVEVAGLAADGVTMVVSALSAAEERDRGLAAEQPTLAEHGIDFDRIPVADFGIPRDEEAAHDTLRRVADHLAADSAHVVIHCAAALGRSPTLVAGLLVVLGDSPGAAWTTVTEARGSPVPETEAQRAWPDRLVGGIGS